MRTPLATPYSLPWLILGCLFGGCSTQSNCDAPVEQTIEESFDRNDDGDIELSDGTVVDPSAAGACDTLCTSATEGTVESIKECELVIPDAGDTGATAFPISLNCTVDVTCS